MKKAMLSMVAAIALAMAAPATATAQISWGKALSGLVKTGQALTITDEQMAEYVKASVAEMDRKNKLLPASNPYSQRLQRLTDGITDADGIPLNFKVYETTDVNAFACPDGSVRVYTGLMDLMTDDEVLGVVGHEIGHVIKRHSRNAFRNQLLTGALRDGLAAAGGRIGALSESQLGAMGEALINAKYSRSQENEADNCGYDFLVKHHRNPYGMVTAFEKLGKLEQASGAQSSLLSKAFADHPDTAKRIANMTRRCEKDGYTRPSATSTAKTSTTQKTTTTTKKKTTKKSSKKR